MPSILFPLHEGLTWFSSASQYVQQEITKQDLDFAAKIQKGFETSKFWSKNRTFE